MTASPGFVLRASPSLLLSSRRVALVLGVLVLVGCNRAPPPKAVSEAPPAAAVAEAPPTEAVFDMREVPVFYGSQSGSSQTALAQFKASNGAYALCSTEPNKEVKAYLPLKSAYPLYGALRFDCAPLSGHLRFDRDLSAEKANLICFVLDESGEVRSEEAQERMPPWDEARQSRYDRLYIDANRDLDLTNDPVLTPMKKPPWWAMPAHNAERMIFDYLDINVDYGPGVGVRPFRVLPWLSIDESRGYSAMSFVAATAREGRIRMGRHQYDAVLGCPGCLSGRFDRPWTVLFLRPVDPQDWTLSSEELAYQSLMKARWLDGTLYTTSVTPLGDKLTVTPYRGDFGVVTVGPGDRDIKDISFRGSLQSQTMVLDLASGPVQAEPQPVARPPEAPSWWFWRIFQRGQVVESPERKPEKMREYKVPVGDYLPLWLYIEYGPLRLSVSDNRNSDGCPGQPAAAGNFFIEVRKDKPFVLDFSNKPDILFLMPAKDTSFKLGATVEVWATLIDPVCDIVGRSLQDTRGMPNPLGLKQVNAFCAITDSSGKKLAEGALPSPFS